MLPMGDSTLQTEAHAITFYMRPGDVVGWLAWVGGLADPAHPTAARHRRASRVT